MLETGTDAPGFELPDQHGETASLADLEGRVLLYFYPKAKTPGCRTEARRFRDTHESFRDHDVTVVGISPDPIERLAEFADDEGLQFTLLSDTDGEVADAYGCRATRRIQGTEREMTLRNSYLVGPEGSIEATYESVTPSDHPTDVLEDLAET